MRKISNLLLAFVAVIGLNACSSDDDIVFVAQPDPEGISFVNSFNSQYILTPATADNTAERFVWNEIDVEVPTNLTYELQGSTDAAFESFDVMGETGSNNLAVSVGQLLELAEDAGMDNDPSTEDMPNSGQLYFRVVASAGNAGELAHTSEVEALTVVLPEGEQEEDLRELYFVGNATPDDWNNNGNNYPLYRDAQNPDVYYYTGYFNAGEFKILEELGAWQPQYGTNDGATVAVNPGGGDDPASFTVATAGYYSFQINLEEMTFTMEEYDASEATTYETIGFLGDSTVEGYETGDDGWGADVDMTQSDFNAHIWYAGGVSLTNGELKFRAADAWDVSWGIDSGALSDKANPGGQNIPVAAGVYDIWFNDLTGRYILIPQAE